MRHRLTTIPAAIAISAVVAGCGQPSSPGPSPTEHHLARLVESTVSNHETVPAAALYVFAPRVDLEWQGAAGVADPATGEPMTAAHPIRIASNTKTYIAASTLRLWEDGQLALDDPIALHLPQEIVELLRGDGYRPGDITVRHLLTHTAGLYDYADREIYTEAILADPLHRWTRTEQLEAAVQWGDPLAEPGEVYSYSDTGYILLGSILEQATGKPMPDAVRELIGYRRLALSSTWFDTLEPRPAGVRDLAHQFTGSVDAATIDASADLYGGGGITTTVRDLGRFTHALFSGDVYSNPGTVEVMLTTIDDVRLPPDGEVSHLPPGAYRMGVWVVQMDGLKTYWHTGFWGTAAVHVPELDLTIAAAVNQNSVRPALDDLVTGALHAVRGDD